MQDEKITCNGKATFEFGVRASQDTDIEDIRALPEHIKQQFSEMIDSLSIGVYDKAEISANVEESGHHKFDVEIDWNAEWTAPKADYDGITADDIDYSVGLDIKYILEHKLGLERRMGIEVTDWKIKESNTKITDVPKRAKDDYVRD